MKLFILLITLITSVAFSNSDCLKLCGFCSENQEDSTCIKVSSICRCPILLDSVRAVQDSITKIKTTFATGLAFSCDNEVCAQKVFFKNGIYHRIEKTELTLSNDEIKTHLLASGIKKDSTEVTDEIVLMPPMINECIELCGSCVVSDSSENGPNQFENEFCQKIDNSCKCIDHAKNAYQVQQKAKMDSIARIEAKVVRLERAMILVDSLQTLCNETINCVLHFTYGNSTLTIFDLQKRIYMDNDSSAYSNLIAKPSNSALLISPKESPLVKDSTKQTFVEKNKSNRLFYFGFSLAFEHFLEDYVGDIDVMNSDEVIDQQFGLNLGFLLRWYFYRWGSFQTGLNAIFHYAYYDEAYSNTDILFNEATIEYYNLMVEIPLEFRFGFPIGRVISPYVSISTHIRKPIYAWIMYDYDYNDDKKNGAYTEDDWEFMEYIGLGLEISRHVSLQWQFAIFAARTNVDFATMAYDTNLKTWRINADFAF